MPYLRHVQTCNRHDPAAFLPFLVNGLPVGMIPPTLAGYVADVHSAFQPLRGGGVDFVGDGPAALTAAMDATLATLESGGRVPRRRGELYPALTRWGADPLFLIDRAAAPLFGLPCFGIHLNGYVRRADGLHLWVGRRARDRSVAAGKFDNMVAGGQPAGLSLDANLAKEAYEEAGLSPDQVAPARQVGILSYTMDTVKDGAVVGVRRDTLFCYDLELPSDVVPHNTDGEVEGFELWPVARVADSVRRTDDWKFNVNLVVMDFLIRHGVIAADDLEYPALAAALGTRTTASRGAPFLDGAWRVPAAPGPCSAPYGGAQNRSSIAL